jgi:hypothetical protein
MYYTFNICSPTLSFTCPVMALLLFEIMSVSMSTMNTCWPWLGFNFAEVCRDHIWLCLLVRWSWPIILVPEIPASMFLFFIYIFWNFMVYYLDTQIHILYDFKYLIKWKQHFFCKTQYSRRRSQICTYTHSYAWTHARSSYSYEHIRAAR